MLTICSICHKVSANGDHLDCTEKKRIELEDAGLKQQLLEKLDVAKSSNELNVEMKAMLEHLNKEKKKSD